MFCFCSCSCFSWFGLGTKIVNAAEPANDEAREQEEEGVQEEVEERLLLEF